jgi:MFS transporter, AAHS family, 4-hydroxybenzoate transporter
VTLGEAEVNTVNISDVIERQRPNRTVFTLIIFSFLIMLCDGYDLQAIAFASPTIVANWGIEKASLGFVFSAGSFGIMLGGFLFGYLADRIGRRPAFLLGTLLFSLVTLSTVLASNVTQLAVLRFIAGLGIGGVTPICFALNVEYVPQRFRATVVAFVMMGYAIGTSVGGLFAAWLVPQNGWHALFYIGGLAPLALLPLLALALPESIKYLLVSGKNPHDIHRLVKNLDPSVQATTQTRFVLDATDDQATMASWKDSAIGLFRGELARITPVLWVAFMASSTTLFLLASWIPILTVGTGRSAAQAAIGLTLFSIGGAFGGLFSGRLIDKLGVASMAPIPLIAAGLVIAIGAVEFSDTNFLIMLCAIGFFVFGGHFGLLGAMGLFYPSANRANGMGWALSIGKLGSILGPAVAAILIARHASLSQLLLVAAAPLPIVALGGLALGQLQKVTARRFDGPRDTHDVVADVPTARLAES